MRSDSVWVVFCAPLTRPGLGCQAPWSQALKYGSSFERPSPPGTDVSRTSAVLVACRVKSQALVSAGRVLSALDPPVTSAFVPGSSKCGPGVERP